MKNNGKNQQSAYLTYALAEKSVVDKKTKATRPSDIQVEEMRKFSIENKK